MFWSEYQVTQVTLAKTMRKIRKKVLPQLLLIGFCFR